VVGDFLLTDALGVVGSLMLVGAYWMVTRRRLDPEALPYNLANLAGSALLLVSLWVRPNHGAILIEVLWAAIAITAIVRVLARGRGSGPG